MTMKRTLLTLVVAILGACMTFVSCTSSEEDPIPDSPSTPSTPSAFTFPSKITHSMGADESKSISIEPNATWEISLSKSAAADFYIADGDHKRQNMRGEAGKFSIEIKTTSTLDFENDVECQVTMTMKDDDRTESKVIAELTKNKAQREVTLYAAKVENGSFVEQEGEDGSNTVYNTDEVDSDGIFMVVSKDDIDDIEARFKVAANCDWTMILPEWLEANEITGNASAQKEISLKVKTDLLPEDVYSGEIEFIATENEASIKIVQISINSEAIAKTAEIYPAQIADGEYIVIGEGENGTEYLFSEEQVAQAGHSMRVNAANITEIDALFKVVTNFKWNIEAPEWIKPIETQEVGESVVLLEVDYSKLPAQGDVEGELKIIDVAKSKAISTVMLSISAEALTPKVMIYPAKIEDGEFVLPEGESEFAVEYDTNVVGENGIELIWPVDNAWANARVKVESNLPLNINMPEWMFAASELESINISANLQWSAADFYEGMKALAKGPSREKLQIMFARYNNLPELPAEFANFKKMSLLDLAYNKITKLHALGEDVSFVQLYLDNNLIENFPVDEYGYFCGYTDMELGAVIRGQYDYGVGDWSHRYVVKSLTANKMIWVAKDDPANVSVYVRANISNE